MFQSLSTPMSGIPQLQQSLGPLSQGLFTPILPIFPVCETDSLFDDINVVIGPPGPQGATGLTGATGATGPQGVPGIIPVTFVVDSPYTPTEDEYFLAADAGVEIVLPALSDTGRVFIVKDFSGTAETNNITITATAPDLIDGQASTVININFASMTFVYTGVEWSIV